MADTITNTGIITSFSNTPQAGDDLFTAALTGITEDGGTFMLDVMANGGGGKAKTLWLLDDGYVGDFTDDGISNDTAGTSDLLTKDGIGIVNESKFGAAISITADGKVSYTMTDASKAHFQSLKEGEIGTDTFTYAIRLGNGTLSWATATVQITGKNDAPTLAPVDAGSVAEVDQSSSTTDDGLSGTLAGNDVDGDTLPTASVAARWWPGWRRWWAPMHAGGEHRDRRIRVHQERGGD